MKNGILRLTCCNLAFCNFASLPSTNDRSTGAQIRTRDDRLALLNSSPLSERDLPPCYLACALFFGAAFFRRRGLNHLSPMNDKMARTTTMTPIIQKILYITSSPTDFFSDAGCCGIVAPHRSIRMAAIELHQNMLPAAARASHNPSYFSCFNGSLVVAGGVTAGLTTGVAGGTLGPGEGAACMRG